jgi:hypothetical protein
MKWSTHKSLWWVSCSEEAFLKFALMGLVSLPIIIWAIIFLLVISRNELALLHSGDRPFLVCRVASAEDSGANLIWIKAHAATRIARVCAANVHAAAG